MPDKAPVAEGRGCHGARARAEHGEYGILESTRSIEDIVTGLPDVDVGVSVTVVPCWKLPTEPEVQAAHRMA